MNPNALRPAALAALVLSLSLAGCQRSDNNGGAKPAALSPDKPATGEITLGDRVNYGDGTRSALFAFELAAGEAVAIEATAAFCGRLSLYALDDEGRHVLQPLGDRGCVEKDGRHTLTHSRLSPAGGRYLLAFSGREPGHFGPYRVSLSTLSLEPDRDLVAGDEVTGLLEQDKTLVLKIAEAGRYQLDLRSSEFDATLTLEGPDVSRESDDDGEGTDARITAYLPAGDYRLGLGQVGSGGGLYRLAVLKREGGSPADLQSGGELAPGREVSGLLEGEPATYTLDLAERSRVVLALGSDDFDTRLDLGGETVGLSDDDGGDDTDSRLVTELDPGRYTLQVVDLGGDHSGVFTLSARVEPASGPMPVLAPGTPQSGALAQGEQRRFRLSVPTAGSYVLSMESDGLDSLLQVLRGGDVLATDDDGGGGSNARVELDLAPGEYEVVAIAFGGGSGDFRLRAERR